MLAMPDWLLVLLLALVTALATGLGALPFLIKKEPSPATKALATAAAAGLMLGASFGLLYEGIHGEEGTRAWRTVAGLAAGLIFISVTGRYAQRFGGEQAFANLSKASATRAILIVAVMTLHSAAEGVGVGVSFGQGQAFGLYIAIAIAIHNIPEGLAISVVMVPKGTPVWQAALWSIASSLPQPLLAVPAFLFVEVFTPWLPVGLGFAGGAMIWMCFSELFPEALEDVSAPKAAVATTLALGLMLLAQALLPAA
jgi:zinc transporter ZupT